MVHTRSRDSRLIPGLFSPPSVLLAALQTTRAAWAGDAPLGHRVIAKLAERHLSDRARAEHRRPCSSRANPWPTARLGPTNTAGSCRRRPPGITSMSRSMSPGMTTGSPGTSPAKGFIVPKIRELRAILKDRSRPVEERRQALRFLVHLVEDLHMPLHVGENHDKGGNNLQVRWFDRGSNLHRVWDSGHHRPGRAERRPLARRAGRDGHRRGPREGSGRLRRGLGDRNPCWRPGKPTRTPRRASGSSRVPSWGCLPGRESAGGEATALSGRRPAGEGAQRRVPRRVISIDEPARSHGHGSSSTRPSGCRIIRPH